MCGITGIHFFKDNEHNEYLNLTRNAVGKMQSRGPDNSGLFTSPNIVLGHKRLSIIDVTKKAAQPFNDSSGKYTIVYNGEIYNFKQLRETLLNKGYNFKSQSDTEVLLNLYIDKGEKCLNELNGFFSFAIYDNREKSLFLSRDRYGIKPLYYYHDKEKFVFASEMKALVEYKIPKKIDKTSLFTYLQLNYIPGPWTIFENVYKLLPGHFILTNNKGEVKEGKYYTLPQPLYKYDHQLSYNKCCEKLHDLVEESVLKRLVSDVPLGTFLSGGIDSSIVSALAAKHVKNLNTFSIGFKDEAMFDETRYANTVAKMHNTNHTVFSITNDDLFSCLFEVLNYLDEPFADSSALAVYILSKETRKNVTVALSGDGADELFAGYNKHMAEYCALHPGIKEKILTIMLPLLSLMPQSRNNIISNKIRQAVRFGEGMKFKPAERYWLWCSVANEYEAANLLIDKNVAENYLKRKNTYIDIFRKNNSDINNTLYSDIKMVLPYDMLTKVDMMSMANSLEVRVPFLDHQIVDYVSSLPEEYKITNNSRKKILKDTFSYLLPKEIINRSKHGFEVPLLKWFRNELSSFINNEVLEKSFIEEQNIFDPIYVNQLKQQLQSANPGDAPARIWGLIVFQKWWGNYCD